MVLYISSSFQKCAHSATRKWLSTTDRLDSRSLLLSPLIYLLSYISHPPPYPSSTPRTISRLTRAIHHFRRHPPPCPAQRTFWISCGDGELGCRCPRERGSGDRMDLGVWVGEPPAIPTSLRWRPSCGNRAPLITIYMHKAKTLRCRLCRLFSIAGYTVVFFSLLLYAPAHWHYDDHMPRFIHI